VLVTLGLSTTPAAALRLAPPDVPRQVAVVVEPVEDTSLLLSIGRLVHHAAEAPDDGAPGPDEDELVMSAGRLLG